MHPIRIKAGCQDRITIQQNPATVSPHLPNHFLRQLAVGPIIQLVLSQLNQARPGG